MSVPLFRNWRGFDPSTGEFRFASGELLGRVTFSFIRAVSKRSFDFSTRSSVSLFSFDWMFLRACGKRAVVVMARR